MRDERHGILMSSHITSDLEKIADYIVCIDAGRIVFAVEKDTITDLAGIAHCRATDYERIAESGFFCAACATPTASTYWLPTVSRSPRTSRTSPSTRPISMSTWA